MTSDSDYTIRVAVADMGVEKIILKQLKPIPGIDKPAQALR